jgi:hypothetical protein
VGAERTVEALIVGCSEKTLPLDSHFQWSYRSQGAVVSYF